MSTGLPPALAIIDVETTGARPLDDRITEVAVVRIEHGRQVARWSSLVDPGVPIPAQIRHITGISDAMVAAAPGFAALADELRRLLADAVFVAHNARFDYAFVRNAFRRCGEPFEADVLCTVKLSRTLYPQFRRHGLDALIDRHGLACAARHRALGDVDALAEFLQRVEADFPAPRLAAAVAAAMKPTKRAPALADGVLESLPASAGAYLFYDEQPPRTGRPCYVGSGRDLRSRITEHFAAADDHGRRSGLARQVRHVEVIETAGELGALLLASRLVARHRPGRNHLLDTGAICGLQMRRHRRKPPVLTRVPLHGADPLDWTDRVFGVFRSPREVDQVLARLAQEHRLCPARLGLVQAGTGACAAHRNGLCEGVCAGREAMAEHDRRLAGALARLGPAKWPWAGAIAVRETSTDGIRHASHIVDHWCLLGTADDECRLAELLAERPPRRFDYDHFRILQRWLASAAHRHAVVPID
ncbi:MAG: ethanolamine utilization protein [Rhodocyclaceae bacterium]|nr:ethanolamine utilization protein [Rhodocyclaceae bacterium]